MIESFRILRKRYLNFSTHFSYIVKSGFANFIPLCTLPIIARMYDASAFGVYAIYSVLVAILSIISMLAYQNLVLNLEDEKEAGLMYVLCAYMAALASLFAMIVLLLLPSYLLESLFGAKRTGFFLVGVTLFLVSINSLSYTWFIRKGMFESLARNKIILAVLTSIIQVLCGLLDLDYVGLILANILGLFVSILLVWAQVPSIYRVGVCDLKRGISLIWKNRSLPLSVLPGSLIDAFAVRLPEIAINIFFGPWWLGQYSMVQRAIAVPLAFLSGAVQDIFRSKSAALSCKHDELSRFVIRFLLISVPVSMLIYLTLYYIFPSLLVAVLGQEWLGAAGLLGVLGAVYCIQFVASPLSYLLIVRRQYLKSLSWQVAYLAASGLVLFAPLDYLNRNNFHNYLLGFSSVIVSMYFIYILISMSSLNGDAH